jgi:hypothetical protein
METTSHARSRGSFKKGKKQRHATFFPSPNDAVPDGNPDFFTTLWNIVVGMAKPESNASSKETSGHDQVLYRLGIDVVQSGPPSVPETVPLAGEIHETVEYKHLQTPEQFAAAAKQFKRYSSGLNEATLIGRIMPRLFLFADIPVLDDPSKALVPCQVLEFPGPFASYDKFNKSLYTFVRSKRIEPSQPFKSKLRFKCDLTIMAYKNALLRPLRDECATYPGVYC